LKPFTFTLSGICQRPDPLIGGLPHTNSF